MKTNSLRMWCARCAMGAWIFISTLSFSAAGQNNSWTSPDSGRWEDPQWSLAVLPGNNQAIFFTNSGSKTLDIEQNTSKNYPQTFNISSLYVSSPGPDSVNTLLLNHSGLKTILQLNGDGANFILGTNCHVLMRSSALAVSDFSRGDFSIGGTFDETEHSWIFAENLNVGDLAPGVFNLNNSALIVAEQSVIGGGFPATFNQKGGTNDAGALALYDPGQYNLYDGNFNGFIVFLGGVYNQYDGDVSATFVFFGGIYNLAGGTLSAGDLTIPAPGIYAFGGIFSQSGGTNTLGGISLGNDGGFGEYILSGGTLSASSLFLQDDTAIANGFSPGVFSQSGGYHTNGSIGITGTFNQEFYVIASEYDLSGGILATPAIDLNMGNFYQSGGTNEAGSITLSNISLYNLSGGWLFAQTIQHSGGYFYTDVGSIQQSGGTNQVGTLSLSNVCFYTLSGGRLIVDQIQIDNATFNLSLGSSAPGSLDGMQLLTLAAATWNEQSGGQQSFGQLQLSGNSNSFLVLPSVPCALNFADSSGLVWSNAAALSISNWSGSLYGGGAQQVTFGNSASALTAQQVSQLQFQNPAGLPSGIYPARILATGEIVPDTGGP